MAVSLTPAQLDHVNSSATETSTNGSSDPGTGTFGKLTLCDWMRILSLLIALLGLVGNSLVLWLLGFRNQRNPFSVYILNLAGADALFLCCSFVMLINEFSYYLSLWSTYWVVYYFRHIFYTVGLSLLAAISTERCLSVLFPIWYRCHRPKHTSAAVCAGLWALGGLLGVADYVFCIYVYLYWYISEKSSSDNVTIIQLAFIMLLTCVLCVSSLTLLLRVQCSPQRRQPPRLYRLVLLTVLVFLLCGLPLGLQHFRVLFYTGFLPYWLRHLLACVNSSANPFIYFFLGRLRHKRVKEPLRVILQRALGGEQELGNGERDTPHQQSRNNSLGLRTRCSVTGALEKSPQPPRPGAGPL